MTDPIADYLTRLRNAIMAHHRVVEVPASNLKKSITKILFEGVHLELQVHRGWPSGYNQGRIEVRPSNKAERYQEFEARFYTRSSPVHWLQRHAESN